MLNAEKEFMEAAKRNDVEAMRSLARGLNANAKNVVGPETNPLSASQCFVFYNSTHRFLWDFV